MASPDVIIKAVNETSNNQDLSRYDENVCLAIQKKLDSNLKEKDLSISERAVFARNNFVVMDKWEKIFPVGITECLREYFRERAIWAPKFDSRFPNQNQVKNCFVNYVDYQRCMKLKGEDSKDCEYFKQASKSLCPNQWLEKFDEQIQADAFPVDI